MQVARQTVTLVFTRRLDMMREFGQLRCALDHLDLKPVTFGLHHALLLQLLQLERHGLALVHEQQHQPRQAQHDDADAAQRQGTVDAFAAMHNAAFLAGQQLAADRPDLVHFFLADAALENFRGRVGLALLHQPDRQLQFGQLAARVFVQLRQNASGRGVGTETLVDLLHGELDLPQRCSIRLQIFRAAGEQETAGTRLGIDYSLGQALQTVLRLRQYIDMLQPIDRLPISRLADQHDGGRDNAGQWEYHVVAPEHPREKNHLLRPWAIVGSFITLH